MKSSRNFKPRDRLTFSPFLFSPLDEGNERWIDVSLVGWKRVPSFHGSRSVVAKLEIIVERERERERELLLSRAWERVNERNFYHRYWAEKLCILAESINHSKRNQVIRINCFLFFFFLDFRLERIVYFGYNQRLLIFSRRINSLVAISRRIVNQSSW